MLPPDAGTRATHDELPTHARLSISPAEPCNRRRERSGRADRRQSDLSSGNLLVMNAVVSCSATTRVLDASAVTIVARLLSTTSSCALAPTLAAPREPWIGWCARCVASVGCPVRPSV